MIYRTAHRSTYRSINNNLGSLSYRISELTNQIASQRRINTPSDDPSGAAKVLGTRSTLSSISQYRTSIAVSDAWLTDSSNAAQSIKTTLDEIYAQLEQGSTDSYNSSQRKVMLTKMEGLFESLIKDGDTKIGDTYIFGGQSVTTQPFSLQVEAQKVMAGCKNSTRWTGKIVNYGDAVFKNRPDLPIHSQKFLVEVVQPGGVDSRLFSSASTLSTGFLKGTNYGLRFSSDDKQYNNTEIKLLTGKKNNSIYGSQATKNGIQFSVPANSTPVNIKYVLGNSTDPTSASWNGQDCVVTLKTNADGTASVATAAEVISSINAASPPAGVSATLIGTAGTDDTGIVGAGENSYNNKASVSVDGNVVTVYLEREDESAGGKIITTAQNVADLINADPKASPMITATVTSGGANIVSPTPANITMQTGVPYTLARAAINPKGTQNDLLWSVKNNTPYIGEAGNSLSVEYRVNMPLNTTPSVTFDPVTNEIVVNVATSAVIYDRVFAQYYNDPASGAYQNYDKAHERALAASITTTANDVRKLVEEHPDLGKIVDVSLADGSSGEGKVNLVPKTQFKDGYQQPAMFRVSQDGGKTWGPPMSFAASEYKTGDMFYNAKLGHASMTTNLPGKANDLVFTANQMGSWGNEVRVEYGLPKTHPSNLEVTVGPNQWNINVNLATDASGNVISTANDIMKAVNSHATASQLVTADLANYHEGGNGVVRPMECVALKVDVPYQVDGKTYVKALGHAGATVSFGYSPATQKNPNIQFQAIKKGSEGNDIGVRYTTSADPSFHSSASVANKGYQDFTSVRYEKTPDGKTVMVVHLASKALPSCPDPEKDREGAEKWKALYPVYSCTETRAVISTAASVIEAITKKNLEDPTNAVVWPSLERWPDGLESSAKVGPTKGTVWLTGGNETDDAANHGIDLRFIPDGSSLQVGDVFEVPVGWYHGDDRKMDINASAGIQNSINITGSELLGANGQSDNILDTVQRIIWALKQDDTELIAKELPGIRAAIEKITTLEAEMGTRMIRNEFAKQNLEQAKLTAEEVLSTVEDADFADLITELKNAQTVYEACLGATGLTNKLSLLNYI